MRLDRMEVSDMDRVGRRSKSSVICDKVVEASNARDVKRSSGIIIGYRQYIPFPKNELEMLENARTG